MEEMNKYGIVLDGKLDEAVWEGLPAYTGFKMLKKAGGQLAEKQTVFKILLCTKAPTISSPPSKLWKI